MSICSSALGRDGGGSIEAWLLLLLNDPEQETDSAISELMRIGKVCAMGAKMFDPSDLRVRPTF